MKRKISLAVCMVFTVVMLLSSTALGISITSITLKAALTMEVGEKCALVPVGASAEAVKWESSDDSVAKVDATGIVTGVKAGKTTITASSGSISGKSVVTVTAKDAPVTIQIPVYERGNVGMDPEDNSYWSKWITENALKDINVNVKWVSIPRTTDAVKYGLLIAAGQAPDLFMSYDMPVISGWYAQGALQEIPKDLFNTYTPELRKLVPESTLKFGYIKGRMFYIMGKRPLAPAGEYVDMIRQDWLDKVGMKAPATVEEKYQVYKAFKEKKVGGGGTIPLAFSISDLKRPEKNYEWRKANVTPLEIAMYSDVGIPALTWYPEKERLKWYNKLYNEGLISPEFALDRAGNMRDASFMNGKAGQNGTYIVSNPAMLATLTKNVPEAKLTALPVMKTNAYGEKLQQRLYWDFGMINGISVKCKNPEAVLKYLNWMATPSTLKVLMNGIEGKNYKVTSGKIVRDQTYKGTERLMNGNNKDYYCTVLETTNPDYTDETASIDGIASRLPKEWQYLSYDAYKSWKESYSSTNYYTDYFFPSPVKSFATNSTRLFDQYGVIATKLVMSKPADFEKKYAEACKQYLAMGYKQVIEERKKIFEENELK